MSLSREEIAGLMRLIRLTKDDEIDCERCLTLVAEFAERELAGRSIPVGLEAVEHHLSLCAECREEYEALLRALKAMDAS
jgi:predicted anti-sigma-YlaC factor YlaD